MGVWEPPHPNELCQYLGLERVLGQAGTIPAQPAALAGGAIGPGQAAVLGVAQRLPSAHPAPQLGADVLLRGVGAVLEVLAKDLLALLVQAVEGSLAGQLGGQGEGFGRGVEQAVAWKQQGGTRIRLEMHLNTTGGTEKATRASACCLVELPSPHEPLQGLQRARAIKGNAAEPYRARRPGTR